MHAYYHTIGDQLINYTFVHVHVGVQPTTFSDWEKIDAVELREGERLGKPREKVTSLQTMLDIINQSNT